MKRLFVLLILLLGSETIVAQGGYTIKVHLKHFNNGKLYLGNYYGKNTFIIDSTQISDEGIATFKGIDRLSGGIYFILYPEKKKYFELLIDDQQHFSIEADTTHNFSQVSFDNSPLNVLFQRYNRFLSDQQKKVKQADAAGKDSSALAALQADIQRDIHQYRVAFIGKHPRSLLAMLFRAMQDPVVPKRPENNKDSAFAYHYFRSHYWDGIDFSDNRIVRTPLLETRLHRYFTQLVPPVPDSVNQAADKLLAKARADKEVFKYVLWWLTSTYEKSPYMGMDAVFVHLVEKYYVNGDAYWVSEDQLRKIIDKAAKIAPNLIGNTAPALSLQTPDLKPVNLADIEAKYIILVFWDPTCGHCKVIVPELDSAYQSSWKTMGVKMVGVLSGGTQSEWEAFIKEHHLEDWINLWDPTGKNLYRRPYDVYMTPVIYLLDKHKKIRAKHLDVEQLNAFLAGRING